MFFSEFRIVAWLSNNLRELGFPSPRKILRLRVSGGCVPQLRATEDRHFCTAQHVKKKRNSIRYQWFRSRSRDTFWPAPGFFSSTTVKNYVFLFFCFFFLGPSKQTKKRMYVPGGASFSDVSGTPFFRQSMRLTRQIVKNAKCGNGPTSQDSVILGGSKRHFFGLRARCENKWV